MKNAIKVSKQTRNLLAYVIGTIIVLFGTILLVALATGWQYDFTTGELHDTGLLIINSEPDGAAITINGTPLKQKTPYRYTNVLPGEYEVGLTLAGFRPWVRQTTVAAERVGFNDYAWLIPDTVPSRPRFTDRPIIQVIQSVDRRRTVFVEQPVAVAGQAQSAPRLSVTTDWSREPTTLYAPTVPALNATTPAPSQVASFDSLQLSADGQNLLVRQVLIDGTTQYLILPTNPSDNLRVTNLSVEASQVFEWMEWGPSGNNELWVKNQGTLSRWLVNEHRLESSGLSDITYADWSFEKLLTITPDSSGTLRLQARDRDSLSAPITLSIVPASPTYTSVYFRGIDHDYVALLPAATGQLMLSRDIFSNRNDLVTSIVGRDISQFTVNRSGRHLLMNEKDRLVSIDLENYRRSRMQANLVDLRGWEWINDQHLILSIGTQFRIIDFDGQNNQLIAEGIVPGSPIVFGENKSLLGFTQNLPTSPTTFTHYFLNPEKILE
jgi:hypothetical protein